MSIKYNHGDSVIYPETSVALGTFDGLHTAHIRIIDKAKKYAREHGIACGVMMFDTIPASLTHNKQVPQLTGADDRVELLSDVDFVYVEKFDSEFSNMSVDDFVDYLKNTLKVKAVSVGFNYRFGKGASGSTDTLKKLCKNAGIEVFVTEKTELLGDVVSSTRIRQLVQNGCVDEAKVLLGRPYFIKGKVCHGLKNGTLMGIPTANIEPLYNVVIPKDGVYSGYCTVNKQRYAAVINIGCNPTFNAEKKTIECHLLDFAGDLYEKEIKASFLKFIRDEIKFNSPEELIQQINNDIDFARKELKDYE